MRHPAPLYGPIPGRTRWGDAALFEDAEGTVIARMTIMACYAVPIFVLTDPKDDKPHDDPATVVARCPLLDAPGRTSYRGWDDPAFRHLCERFGIDPGKQRPTFDAWCRDVGEALLDCAVDALEVGRSDEQAAAGLAAQLLCRNGGTNGSSCSDVVWRLEAIRDPGLRERTRNALEQLERSADWQESKRRTEASRMREMIDEAIEAGVPVTIIEDADGPGGVVVFGNAQKTKPTLMERVRRLCRWRA